MGVVRMLITSAIIGAEGSVRAGAELAELGFRRTPPLVGLGARATVGSGGEAAWAQSAFRDELLTLYDDAAEIAWRRLRRARDEFGLRTSPPPDGTDSPALNGLVARRHRVKV